MSGTFQAIFFDLDSTHRLGIFMKRHGPLNTKHADHDEKGSRISFGLGPIESVSRPTSSLGPDFSNFDEGVSYWWANHEVIPYQRIMEVPRDEWRLSLEGYADVYIANERMYTESDEIDEGSGKQPSNIFVDVVDIIIRVKGDPGYRDAEGSQDKDGGNSESEGEGGEREEAKTGN
ncbi:hypothetical protein GGR58DRAFT_509470 [Xylaria digitata]|nr:hypothetical protein GGR58DRAFT_509470 [Xylaria digitata]